MQLTYEWKKSFDQDSESVYVESLSTLIGSSGAQRLLEVARVYEEHDWLRLLIAKNEDKIAGIIALYYEPLHGSHEGWICVHPQFRRKGVGDKLQEEFEKGAIDHGIKIFRADATLAYTHSQKYLYRRDYKSIGYTPMSFSFIPGEKSLGSAITIWKIFDEDLLSQYNEEKRDSLDWEQRRWSIYE